VYYLTLICFTLLRLTHSLCQRSCNQLTVAPSPHGCGCGCKRQKKLDACYLGFITHHFAPFLVAFFFGGLPPLEGLKLTTSLRRNRRLPATSMGCKRPRLIKSDIAAVETPRSFAASDCVIKSFGISFICNPPKHLDRAKELL
jgi:hypothetical protein